jgi:hypothetical protein
VKKIAYIQANILYWLLHRKSKAFCIKKLTFSAYKMRLLNRIDIASNTNLNLVKQRKTEMERFASMTVNEKLSYLATKFGIEGVLDINNNRLPNRFKPYSPALIKSLQLKP